MPEHKSHKDSKDTQSNQSRSTQSMESAKETAEQTETDPAVERGERIQSSKEIARAGKSQGKVPGAEEPNAKQ